MGVSLGTWPGNYMPRVFKLQMSTNQRVNASPFGGSEQAVDMLNDRWMCEMTLPARRPAEAAAVEALIASFRGQVNWISLWHFKRPQPRGTISGNPTLSEDADQGADEIKLQTTAGVTIKGGDMVGLGGKLLMAAPGLHIADGSGVLKLPIVNRLRAAQLSGAAVTLVRPTAPFRLLSNSGVLYTPGFGNEVELVFGEKP